MRATERQVTIMAGDESLLKRLLRVTSHARHLHLPAVRVAVTRCAVTRKPQESLFAGRQDLRIGVLMTRRARKTAVRAREIEANDLVVELRWIRNASLRKRQAVHELKLAAMVLTMTCRARSCLAIREGTMQTVPVLDLRVDVFMALVARGLHVAKPATVACRTRLAATEFCQPSMHR